MALNSYSALQSAIESWLLRTDIATVAADFITLAEAQINRDVRHWRMITRTDLTIDDQFVDLPTDWVDTIRIRAGTTYPAMALASVNEIGDLRG